MVRHNVSPQKPPGSRLWFSLTGVQHSPGSSAIELSSNLAESSAYLSERALLEDSSRQYLPKGATLESSEEARTWGTPSSSTNHTAAACQPTGGIAKTAIWLFLSRVHPALHRPERLSHTDTPKPGLRGRGHEVNYIVSEEREY